MMKPAHLRIKDTSNESKPKSIVQKKQMTNSTYSEGNNISHNPMQQEEISINSDKTQHHPALDSDKKEEAFIFGGKKLSPTHRPHKGNPWPGRIIGPLGASEQKIFYSNWTYRPLCYELYIGDRRRLARMIFGLARFSGDVEQSMPLARFERGAQAFHYTVSQIIDWANAVEKGQVVLNTNEENEFLNILVKDGVLVKRSGIYAAGGLVSHVLGASPGKRRNLSRNINQERWHVMWDEDAIFRNASIYKWKALSKEKKRQALNKLKGYNHENELQTIEEWAVWGKENISVK